MEERVTPGAFYGSAVAALCGLLLGLLLQQPWRSHPGGPQILFSSAAAAELAQPSRNDSDAGAPFEEQQIAEGAQPLADLDATYNDPGFIPPDPLPVTRLDPGRFDTQPAAADPADRVADDDVADAAPASATPDFD